MFCSNSNFLFFFFFFFGWVKKRFSSLFFHPFKHYLFLKTQYDIPSRLSFSLNARHSNETCRGWDQSRYFSLLHPWSTILLLIALNITSVWIYETSVQEEFRKEIKYLHRYVYDSLYQLLRSWNDSTSLLITFAISSSTNVINVRLTGNKWLALSFIDRQRKKREAHGISNSRFGGKCWKIEIATRHLFCPFSNFEFDQSPRCFWMIYLRNSMNEKAHVICLPGKTFEYMLDDWHCMFISCIMLHSYLVTFIDKYESTAHCASSGAAWEALMTF